ncbi:cupredoxin domain-containing protein [Paenibacillus hamazuiensis]|uniref:cupredoxin domain-containing protein n=1 Tax=Paenibacillus hamazuiensis TaxID=2936508 RepID=UPI00200CB2E7|nr:cupredoxin domain-containing protein [Paenibacillus hamazuiensis]
MRKVWTLAIAVVVIFALAACGKKEEAAPASAPTGPVQEVKLEASNFQFDKPEYKVKKGQDVKITLENKQGVHGVQIQGINVKLDASKLSQTFKADKEGTYDIICSVPCGSGHVNMKAKLVVES